MKLKYYLRGIGIGVLVTTLIFMVSISIHKDDVNRNQQDGNQKSETIAQANKLDTESMQSTEPTETETETETEMQPSETDTDNKSAEIPPEMNAAQEAGTPVVDNTPQVPVNDNEGTPPEEKQVISFTVGKGEYSDLIAGKLAEQKLIDDAEAFNEFLIQKNYDNFILPGTYAIPMDSTFEEIAVLLTTKVETPGN